MKMDRNVSLFFKPFILTRSFILYFLKREMPLITQKPKHTDLNIKRIFNLQTSI